MKYFITGKWKGDFGSYLISAALFYSLISLRVHRILKRRASLSLSLALWLYSLCLWMHPYKMPQQSVVDATAPRHPDDVFWWMFCQQEREWSSGLRRNGEQLNIVLFPNDRQLQQSWLKSSKVPVQAKENIKKKYSTCSEIIDVRRWSTGALSVPLNTE